MLRKATSPSTEFPAITGAMPAEKVLKIITGKLAQIEGQLKAQQIINQTTKASLESDRNLHER